MSENPKGFCQCGCGEKTTIAKMTSKRRGWIKGEPVRFKFNHHSKKEHHPGWNGGRYSRKDGYVFVLMREHPRTHHNGYVYEHILIAEKALGKPLPIGVQIHHHTPEQLVICQDQTYHRLLHQRTRALRACGHVNWLKCRFCKQYDDPTNMNVQSNRNYGCHRECQAAYDRKRNQLKTSFR